MSAKRRAFLSTNRIEAFSDGVIAIIITIMVFDLKINETPTDQTFWFTLMWLIPRLSAYLFSFVAIGIIWVNHHNVFHQVKHTDGALLWHNLHLLFWISLIPFGTNFVGANPYLWQGAALYAFIFLMMNVSFSMLRNHMVGRNLIHETLSLEAQQKAINKNKIAMCAYIVSVIMAPIYFLVTYLLLIAVMILYFLPENILHNDEAPNPEA